MTWLLEDPTPALVSGALLITVAAIFYGSLRTGKALVGLAAAILFTVTGVGIEWLVQTPREQVVQAMDDLLAAVEADNLPRVLSQISPSASVLRAEAERLMPEVEVDKANRVGELKVTLDDPANPTTAEVACRLFVSAQHRRTGVKGGDLAELRFTFAREGDAWLLLDYAGDKKWKQGVSKLRSKR